ncbi:hypothetical protein EXIGLDRAFT_636604 [Exidia glandulosa HHB12029]|uniref:DUF1996 domain-containing protein n=1 Tax=Exidia glandulosa HHB12029 TaxID=1314781 RepID=A0A165Q1Z8_EXIGL|nr:hypothetical protein EXIGLDRAFT_636604 [Exidia glandulosa HHB12029]
MFAVSALLTFATLAAYMPPGAHAFWRLACPRDALVRERADPIVSPGVASGHLHVVHGGAGFALNTTFDAMRASDCTSCEIANDKSNYWTPSLWFNDPKTGKVEPVNGGGILVYYLQRGDSAANLTAFPAGFRMLAGDMTLRSKKFEDGEGSQGELAERALKWSCLRYTDGATGYDGYGFPNTRCEAGFQSRLHMPNCWDGKNLDTKDHKSHVAYMSIMDNGKCPDTHPVPFISMFYEQTWDTGDFDARWDPATDKWPFVWSHGDPTGFGYHGDFIMGWDVQTLQSAIIECNNQTPDTAAGRAEGCKYFDMQTSDAGRSCTVKAEVDEVVTGVLDRLPGCNPIQDGPDDAKVYSAATCPLDGGAPVPAPEPSPAPVPTPTPAPEPETPAPSPSPVPEPEEPTPSPSPSPEPIPAPHAPGPVTPPPEDGDDGDDDDSETCTKKTRRSKKRRLSAY